MAVRILLVDDHELMREGLCELFRSCSGVEVVGQAADGRVAIELIGQLRPDVVIMDITMPNLNGIDATRQIIELHPGLKVLALTNRSEYHIVGKMINAGASGYMLKESGFSELRKAIATILEGNLFLCSHISKYLSSYSTAISSKTLQSKGARLSMREQEVLQLIAEGHTSKEIARILNLSSKTIDSHREHIMLKLHIQTVAGLTKYAIREGMTIP